MSVMQKAVAMAARYLPDAAPDPLIDGRGYVGQPLNRVDGPAKVTGAAPFAAEFAADNLAHAALVCSRIARGRVSAIDTAAAEAAPGVIAVLTHVNAPRLKAPTLVDAGSSQSCAPSDLPILQDDRVSWNGQPVSVVVADTLEQAQYAASLVLVDYASEPAHLSFDGLKPEAIVPDDILGEPPEVTVGDPDAALATAAVRVDHLYRTPWYNHNAIEPHATMATWTDDEHLTVFDSTQCLRRFSSSLGEVFALTPEAIESHAPFVGGGFGGKAGLWQHSVLCAAAAKVVKRPVRLALTRAQVYRIVGGRTRADQRVALGAHQDGRLVALVHTGITATPEHARYAEQCTFPARHLYAADNLFVGQKVVHLDTVANTWMRAPGESIGTFALESALDELAWALKIDPIELRRLNEPATDPTKGTPFSSRDLIEAYKRGAVRFGWNRRTIEPRSQRDGDWLVGQGVATAYYPAYRFPGSARVVLTADGTAQVYAAAHEMGMGTATVQLQHAADRLGLPIEKVSFHYGNSTLPDSPMAGGSCQTVSIIAAVHAAIDMLHKRLVELVPRRDGGALAGATVKNTQFRDGGLFRIADGSKGESLTEILRRAGQDHVEGEAAAPMPLEMLKYSMGSYGAQFCEVRVREGSGEVRVSRWLGSFDCGRVINSKTTASQLRGGIVMGIGMALTEETLLDERTGRIINASLSEYHVPVNLDVPHIEILVNDIADPHAPLGAHGVGELGITGAAAAIANAVFHATGKRVRDLPITLDKLL
jgi:xanthine dehydrogenase YagR molybdenum-binding subunit